jgi:membrane protein required for colicin V production
MLDFIIGLFLAGVLVRGWSRGLVREALDLVGLVAGIWIAFKASSPLGEFLVDRFSVAPEVAVIGSGIVLFLLVGISMSIAAHYLSKVMNLPGLNLVNRFGGAAVGALWATALILVVINVARAFPLPQSWDDSLAESSTVAAIAGADAIPQHLFERLGADGVLGSVASLRALFGTARVVPEGTEALTIPAAAPDETRQVREEAIGILELMNKFRTGEGLGALDSNAGITSVAEKRASAMYESGRLSRDNPPGRDVSHAFRNAGIPVAVAGEDIALASSVRAAFEAMLDSPSGRAQLLVSSYDRAGVAVVDGPTGRLVVVDFGG